MARFAHYFNEMCIQCVIVINKSILLIYKYLLFIFWTLTCHTLDATLKYISQRRVLGETWILYKYNLISM